MPIAKGLTVAFWFGFVIYWLIAAAGAKKSTRRGGAALRAAGLRAAVLVLAVLAFRWLLVMAGSAPSAPVSAGFGVALCAAGLGFAVWARRHLGRNWGVPMSLRAEHELVTSGPYSRVRHPIYTGILVAMIGSALSVGLVWLAPCAVFAGYFFCSAMVEEKLLLRQFPGRYPIYKKQTKMLIPFVF